MVRAAPAEKETSENDAESEIMAAKILVVDMETKPALAYVWGLFDQNISLNQLVSPSAPICFAGKFVGEKKMHFFSDWDDGHTNMIKAAHDLLSEADAVVTYNGDSFDLKKFRGEFVLERMPPLGPLTSIDLLKTVKKLGLQSNKLAYVGPKFGIGGKVKHEGFDLWASVIDGDAAAQKRMEKYCRGDVDLTLELYEYLKPYIDNHPHLGDTGSNACGVCSSLDVQKRGPRRTKHFLVQRLQCNSCGAWSSGTRTKIKPIEVSE